ADSFIIWCLTVDTDLSQDDIVAPFAFSCAASLAKLYADAGLDNSKETIAYCRIRERSSHTWFVLRELLGHQNVKNYDGSWTEYGSLVGAPIELGS
ncbi:sulfurtransferase, partial [Mycobacterium tuberculosis]|uniref:sulfurtransferase n=1 Tax=Mycobacterium tuberculosis TaxID=1773 RepID=UPI0032B46AC5